MRRHGQPELSGIAQCSKRMLPERRTGRGPCPDALPPDFRSVHGLCPTRLPVVTADPEDSGSDDTVRLHCSLAVSAHTVLLTCLLRGIDACLLRGIDGISQ